MPRHLVIGNGKFLINLDRQTYIRDLYYPYVGQLNHVGGYQCRIGLWVDGAFSWLSDPDWNIELSYAEDSLVTEVKASHYHLGITLLINDGVHQRENIYLKRVQVHNHWDKVREVRMFFNQDLVINETEVGDTAPTTRRTTRYFIIKKTATLCSTGRPAARVCFNIQPGSSVSTTPKAPGAMRRTAI